MRGDHGEVLERLEPVLRQAGRRAAEIEAGRALPPDLVEALIDTEVFKLPLPGRLGGRGADLGTILQVVERAAFHDGSTGWVLLVGLAAGLDATRLSRHHAEAVHGRPDALVGGTRTAGGRGRVMDDGGLVVTGRWRWGSAATHATWLVAGVTAADDDTAMAAGSPFDTGPLQVYLRRDQVTVLDTWHALGLRGTGSTDFVANEAVVPEGRWVAGRSGLPLGPRSPDDLGADDVLAIGSAAVALGLAARAVVELAALGSVGDDLRPGREPDVADGTGPVEPDPLRELAAWPPARLALARADAEVRAGRADLRAVAQRLDLAVGSAGGVEPWRDLRSAAHHGVERSVRVVERCYRTAGARATQHVSPLQRLLRDVEVVAQSPALPERALAEVGASLFASHRPPESER